LISQSRGLGDVYKRQLMYPSSGNWIKSDALGCGHWSASEEELF
jgi:hypothetical protein